MTEILTALLTYGPLGIMCAILWMSLVKKDKDIEQLNAKLRAVLEAHQHSLETIYKAQADREKEISETLKSYGAGVVTAVEQTHEIAERLWGIRQ